MEAGLTVGNWTLLKPDTHPYHWLCQCTCGTTKIVRDSSLKSGKSSSCGCLKKQALSNRKTHGMSKSLAYRHWQDLRDRVNHNPEYLKKNIRVCARWQNSFQNFYADMGPRPAGHRVSVERIDNNGDYSPDNCRWGTPEEQNSNKGNCVMITSQQFGTKTRTEWTNILNDQTRSTKWTPRKLKSNLDLMTIDQLLTGLAITDLTCADFAIETLEFEAA